MSVNADRFRKECRNIFSDDKATRKNARAYVISHKSEISKVSKISDKQKSNFLENSENNTSSCEIVSYAVNQFVKNDKFIFNINEKNAGQIGFLKDKIKKIRSSGVHENLPVKSDKPTYVVTMPHHAGNPSLDHQIKLLFEESFGLNAEESVKQAKERLHLFIGVNYCNSINHEANKKKKKYIIDLLKKPSELNVSYEALSWSPLWKFEGKNISQSKVKRLFRLLQEIDSEKASIIYKEVMSHKVIPYQDIREEIIDCKSLSSYFSHFRKDRTDRPCYLLTADDDAVHLRTEGVGLLSHYDKLIKNNPKLKVATTGYFMSDGKCNSVEIITKIFLAARYAHPRSNATYLPEPNILVKIPKKKTISESISFLKDCKSGKLESIGLLEFKGLMEGDTKGQVVVGEFGPIQTGVSPNVKDCSKFESKPEDFLKLETLLRLHSFSQSPMNPRNGFAPNILRTIPNPAWPKGTKIMSVSSQVQKIYKAFDIIEYARNVPSIWYKAYLLIAKEIRELSDSDVLGNDPLVKYGAKSIGKKLNLNKEDTQSIKEFIGTNVVNISKARRKMLKTYKYKEKDVTMIFQSSIKINEKIYLHLKNNVIKK